MFARVAGHAVSLWPVSIYGVPFVSKVNSYRSTLILAKSSALLAKSSDDLAKPSAHLAKSSAH